MFGLFEKKKKVISFYSMIDGESLDITEVPDETFASKVLGDGIAVKPSSDILVAPCEGVVTMIADSKHAIALEDKNGIQILIHIGLDTVSLNGEGFEMCCQEGDKVKVGMPIVKINRSLLKDKELDDVVMLVFVETNNHTITKYYKEENVIGGKSALIELN